MRDTTDPIAFDVWQAAEARHRFGDVLTAADKGRAQHIRHRSGQEYVLISKANYEILKSDLLTVLTSFDFGNEEDEFDRAIAEIRSRPEGDTSRQDLSNAPGYGRRRRKSQA